MSLAALVADAAKVNPNGRAFVSSTRSRSWHEVAADVARSAGGLRALGLGPSDRVAVLAATSEHHAEFACALSWAGLTVVPLNTRLGQAELDAIVCDADVRAVAFEANFRERALQSAAAARCELRLELERCDWIDEAAPRYEWVAGELAALLYTGGTTGAPKGVMLPVSAFAAHAHAMRDALAVTRESVSLQLMPLFHIGGNNVFYGVVSAAGTTVFRPDVTPAAIYDDMRAHAVDTLCAVPTALGMLLAAPGRDDAALERLKTVGYGAAPISEHLLRQALAAMPNARFRQFYGQTETGGPVLSLPPESHAPSGGKLQSAGIPLPHARVRVVDERGVEVAAGVPGEIVAVGSFSSGYWRQPEKTIELFRDGWLRTGDVGVQDDDGFITIVDRHKDMIISGGENVYCIEVENALAGHPAVAECAVIGVPDPTWGESVHAVIVCREGRSVQSDELIAFAQTKIARYKCPKSVEFRSAPLPLSGVGKVLKNVLRANVLEHRAASFPERV
jgi:acyl-CoA synthetase (AMP-forming)/AMP-acid ligase II